MYMYLPTYICVYVHGHNVSMCMCAHGCIIHIFECLILNCRQWISCKSGIARLVIVLYVRATLTQVADDNDRDEHYGDDGDKGKVADASSDVSDYSRGDSPFSHYHVVSAPARTGVRHSGEGKADSQESNTSDSARSSEEGGFGEKGDEELDMHVTGDGGSSGRSTTMINNMEWSATGRIGESWYTVHGTRHTHSSTFTYV